MTEHTRIQTEYARRDHDPALRDLYSYFNPANLFLIQTRERALLVLLKKLALTDLNRLAILDVGCGEGGELLNLLGYGADPARFTGFDLLANRLPQAGRLLPAAVIAQADGIAMPLPSARFDLVFQFTVFTSILDDGIKQRLAAEMLRVLKPGGTILWYDFWANNPANPHVRGVKPAEIRRLFPGCAFTFQRVTLAPPITRRIVPLSWLAAELLAKIPWLLTHYFVAIRKE